MEKCWKCGAALKIVAATPESVPKPLPSMVERRPSVAEVEAKLGGNKALVEISQAGAGNMIRVMPTRYIRSKEKYLEISDTMNKFNAIYRRETDAEGNPRRWGEIL